MKKLLMFSVIALIAFTSCKKEENNAKKITYKVECTDCTVYLDGGLPGPVTTNPVSVPIPVKGSWTSSVENPSTKTFKLHVFVDVFQGSQNVKASIVSDINKSVTMNEQLGSETTFDRLITLDL